MNYKVEVKCQAVQFDGNLVNMPNWFLDRFAVAKQNNEWLLFDDDNGESEIHLGDYVVLYPDDGLEIVPADVFATRFTAYA